MKLICPICQNECFEGKVKMKTRTLDNFTFFRFYPDNKNKPVMDALGLSYNGVYCQYCQKIIIIAEAQQSLQQRVPFDKLESYNQ